MTVVLPLGLPPAHLKGDLCKELDMPALAMLINRAHRRQVSTQSEFQGWLPHEAWVMERLANQPRLTTHLPLADRLARNSPILTRQLRPGFWFLAQPAYIALGREHMLLGNLRELNLSDAESRALFASAQSALPLPELELVYVNARTWLLRADAWHLLQTATPDAATSQELDVWLARGGPSAQWRRVLNACQMSWHEHPVNQDRELQGMPVVNALWLWGGASITGGPVTHEPQADPALAMYSSLIEGVQPDSVWRAEAEWMIASDLTHAALAGDWGRWLAHMHRLDQEIFLPALNSLRAGKHPRLNIVLSNADTLMELEVNRLSLLKFWHKRPFAQLFP